MSLQRCAATCDSESQMFGWGLKDLAYGGSFSRTDWDRQCICYKASSNINDPIKCDSGKIGYNVYRYVEGNFSTNTDNKVK